MRTVPLPSFGLTSLPHADPKVRAEGAIGAKGMALPHGYATSLRERSFGDSLGDSYGKAFYWEGGGLATGRQVHRGTAPKSRILGTALGLIPFVKGDFRLFYKIIGSQCGYISKACHQE